ncbi:hypothetical protein BH10BAC6_BH10BAC6_14970 [soil metagenome]
MIRSFLVLLLLSLSVCASHAQVVIGGVVNRFVAVTSIIPCDSTITVRSTLGFAPGDIVLLMQMQGATVQTPSDSAFGDVAKINGAGAFERLVIRAIDDDKIEFTTPFVHQYDPRGVVQLVRVAYFDNARIIAPVTAPNFDGTIGGVVAIEVRDTLFIGADVMMSGAGFRGGLKSVSYSKCEQTEFAYDYWWGLSGERGEGIAQRVGYTSGRGRWASGGGGGNGNNAGGGGGGGAGEGGHGGRSNYYCKKPDVGGFGGRGMASYITDQRVFLGGGGGGGHDNDSQGTHGATGGGIVMLRARVIDGATNAIDVRGQSARVSDRDGAGGGGAGGSVIIDCDTITSTIIILANGGNGGDNKNEYNVHGPGGGGGGGAVVFTRAHPKAIPSIEGGRSGIILSNNTDAGSDAKGKHWGATDGAVGFLDTNFTWRRRIDPVLTVASTEEICPGDTATLTSSTGFVSYRWNNGDTSRIARTTQPGTYYVVATDDGGCLHRSSDVFVRLDPTLFVMGDLVDFEAIELNSTKIETISFRSTDDDTIVISAATLPNGFTLLQPTPFPVVVAPFATVDFVISYMPTQDRRYEGVMTLAISAPCPTQHTVTIQGEVSPVAARFSFPDTSAMVGTAGFEIPIRMTASPDSVDLPNSTFAVTVSFDARVYKLDTVTVGLITNDVIDIIANKRTTTIRFDSVHILPRERTITSLIGTVLLSSVAQTPLTIDKVEWLDVVQRPATTVRDGTLQVLPDCFYQGRAVKLFGIATLQVRPIPAREQVVITATMSAPGRYSIQIVSSEGKEVFARIYDHIETVNTTAADTLDVRMPVYDLPAGVYVVRFQTPSEIITRTFPVVP